MDELKMTTTEQQLFEIAKQNIVVLENRDNLDAQYSDSLDFLDVAVWELKAALIAAYNLGRSEV